MIQLMHGDCLELMKKIPDQSVDMVMCDLPYGTTQNKWDSVIDLSRLWTEYRRVCTEAVVLTAAQPFTSAVVVSNLGEFKYQWVWEKPQGTGFLNAYKQPLRSTEDILVFYKSQPTYNPQKSFGHKTYNATKHSGSDNYREFGRGSKGSDDGSRFPTTVLKYASERGLHPTQKPIALMEYLIKTYTNEDMTVLDNCMGSGTTGVACVNTNRNFIGIERDDAYFKIAEERIYDAELSLERAKIETLFSEVFA